ncbi:MAG: TadE/TadG family type IV pilus assembly protein [Sphingomicrobium sp.]
MIRALLQRPDGRDQSGSTAAEFALVLPVLLLFLFGIIDAGRLMWAWNGAEKATQMGARMAVVTDMIPGGLAAADYSATLGQGKSVPITSFGAATCKKPAAAVTCTCKTAPCPTLTPINTSAFNGVVTRMTYFLPLLQPSNVVIDYENSGLGYSGDPNGSDVAPIVTVRIQNMPFNPILGAVFGATFKLPEIRADLTLEDGSGNYSN